MIHPRRCARIVLLAALCAGFLGTATGVRAAGEYLLGPEDVVAVTVWEHPELSRTTAVRADGTLTLPPLGDVPVAGKTTTALARDLESKIYNLLRLTTQVTVEVTSFNSHTIYLAGQVTAPGRYAFETFPSLVDLLGQTGGLGPASDISRVRILRKGTSEQQTLTVDLTKTVQSGDVSGLPALQPGDMIFVPAVAGAAGAPASENGVYVLGEVAHPGSYAATAGLSLLQLLSLAGGFTPTANLGEVSVLVRDENGGQYAVVVDLNREVREGRSGPDVRPGDTVLIPRGRGEILTAAWGGVQQLMGITMNAALIHQATLR